MDLSDLSRPVHRLIAGPTGSGKSFFTGALVEQLDREKKRFIVLDTKTKNHFGLLALGDLKLIRIHPGRRYDFSRLVQYDRVLVVPAETMRSADLMAVYTDLIEAVYLSDRDRVLVLEEAHGYSKNAYSPSPILELVAREGRGRGICLWYVTQRIADFSKLLWSQCYYSYLSRFLIPQDVRYIEALIPDFKNLNLGLDRHGILEYAHQTGDTRMIPADVIFSFRRTEHMG